VFAPFTGLACVPSMINLPVVELLPPLKFE
jgi:hypothetical protein